MVGIGICEFAAIKPAHRTFSILRRNNWAAITPQTWTWNVTSRRTGRSCSQSGSRKDGFHSKTRIKSLRKFRAVSR